MIVAIDNDFFCKTEALGVAGMIRASLGVEISDCLVLPSLRFQLAKPTSKLHRNFSTVASQLLEAATLHPELPFPTTEWCDRLASVHDIDAGEVQLLSYVASTEATILSTHDKRAIGAIPNVPGLATAVRGRVMVLEAALLMLCEREGVEAVCTQVCPRLGNCPDMAMRACFGGSRGGVMEGLRSYVNAVASGTDPSVLWSHEPLRPS